MHGCSQPPSGYAKLTGGSRNRTLSPERAIEFLYGWGIIVHIDVTLPKREGSGSIQTTPETFSPHHTTKISNKPYPEA